MNEDEQDRIRREGIERDSLAQRIELGFEELAKRLTEPRQDFSDQLKQLRLRLGLSIDEFCTRYDIPTSEIVTAELARGVEPPLHLRLLIGMVNVDPERVAKLCESVRQRKSKNS